MYALGLWIGEENLRRLIERFERFKLVFVADLERASEVFEHHGGKAILIGHLFPGIGALISIPAGIKRMLIFGRFLTYTALGCILWNGAFIVLGLALGSNWPVVKQYASIIEYVALAAILTDFEEPSCSPEASPGQVSTVRSFHDGDISHRNVRTGRRQEARSCRAPGIPDGTPQSRLYRGIRPLLVYSMIPASLQRTHSPVDLPEGERA